MADHSARRAVRGIRLVFAGAAFFLLVSCGGEISAALQSDEAAVEAARTRIWEDRKSGRTASGADVWALKEAIEKLEYDRQAEPDIDSNEHMRK